MSAVKKAGIGFVSSVTVLSGGALLVQAMTVLSAPVISRLFSPAVFGLAGVFAAIAQLAGPVSNLNYGAAVIVPEDDETAGNVMVLACLLCGALSAVCGLVLWLGGNGILRLMGATELEPYIWLLPIAVLVFGLRSPLGVWASRHKRFVLMANVQVLSTVVRVGLCIGLGWMGYVLAGHLIAFRTIGVGFQLMLLTSTYLWRDGRFLWRNLRLRRFPKLMRRYINFPLFAMPAQFLGAAGYHVPAILMVSYFSARAGGHYSYAVMLLSMPILFFGQSVSQAFMPHIAHAKAHDGDLPGLVEKVVLRMLRLGVVPFGMLMLIGPETFAVYLGGEWFESGFYAAILAPSLFMRFVTVPLRGLFTILEKQAANLVFMVLLFIGQIGGIRIGYLFGDDWLALHLCSSAGVVVMAVQTAWIGSRAGLKPGRLLSLAGAPIALGLPFLAVVAVVKFVLNANILMLFGAAGASGMLYCLLVLYRDRELRGQLLNMLPFQRRPEPNTDGRAGDDGEQK